MVNLFKAQYELIFEKMKLIDKIPRLGGTGKKFNSIEFESYGVLYNTFTDHWDVEDYSLHVPWNEINEPIEFFEAKFAKEIEEDKRKKEEEKQQKEQEKLVREQTERYEKGIKSIDGEIAKHQQVVDSYKTKQTFYKVSKLNNTTTFRLLPDFLKKGNGTT